MVSVSGRIFKNVSEKGTQWHKKTVFLEANPKWIGWRPKCGGWDTIKEAEKEEPIQQERPVLSEMEDLPLRRWDWRNGQRQGGR